MKRIVVFLVLLSISSASVVLAQGVLSGGQVHGNFQTDMQYYTDDEVLGINDSTLNGRRVGLNGFLDLTYTNRNFSAGMRYEAYLSPMLGFDPKYEGHGIPYYYARYNSKYADVTVGNFYEQFGNGLIFRTYQEWNLGYDNSLNGLRVTLRPYQGITLKGVVGTQRYYWEKYRDGNRGVVRGGDVEFYLNDIFKGLQGKKTHIILGGSVVSKYEKVTSKTTVINDSIFEYNLPANVAAFAGRLNISRSGFIFLTEYAYKMNNPSQYNNYVYRPGQALFSSLSYSTKGLGVVLSMKRVDNMSFKSKMTEDENMLDINFVPPLTKMHHYSHPTMYPYATQLNGEYSFQGDVVYTIPRRSKLGGKYGMNISVNYAVVYDIDKQPLGEGITIGQTGTLGYNSDFFKFGGNLFFQDFNVKVTKKFSKKWKGVFTYLNLVYDKDVIEGHHNEYGKVYANIGVLDVIYKITPRHSLRTEYQMLFTKQDRGDWATLTLEYNIAPKFFVSVMDEYNYGNPKEEEQTHYFNVAAGYIMDATRVALSFGRQKEGLLCVGGVCRQVPAATGVTLTITSSF
ncbi:MAG: hypothetical protein CSA95_01980 [Bacteroidetes bacterium]|nr:MAG: hypothetical protein CSA95_01980 [Bacteroidota bacterium]